MEGEKGKRLNIARIFDLHYFNALDKIAEKVDLDKVKNTDEPTDELGYHGKTKWARDKVYGAITECTVEQFTEAIKKDPKKMHQIMLTIRQIDKDHNGYVTRNELDDILKLFYEDLLTKNLDKLIN